MTRVSIHVTLGFFIVSIRHGGLRRLFVQGDASRIRPDMVDKIRTILDHLRQARTIEEMRLPGLRLHTLKGDMQGFWSVTVNANWRVIFRFDEGDALDVDLVDYH